MFRPPRPMQVDRVVMVLKHLIHRTHLRDKEPLRVQVHPTPCLLADGIIIKSVM